MFYKNSIETLLLLYFEISHSFGENLTICWNNSVSDGTPIKKSWVKIRSVESISREDPAIIYFIWSGKPSETIRQIRLGRKDIVRTLWRHREWSRNASSVISITCNTLSVSILRERSILEGSSLQYERTKRDRSLVCQLSQQRHRWVARSGRDKCWKHLKHQAHPEMKNRYKPPEDYWVDRREVYARQRV